MARVKPPEGSRSRFYSIFSGFDLKKWGIFGLVFIAASGLGWTILSLLQESGAKIAWHSCLLEQSDGTLYPEMEEIPAGTYSLPALLRGNSGGETPSARIETPFLIQKGEVTLRQYEKYADHLRAMPEGEEKERLLVRLGIRWEAAGGNGSSVNAISWEGAWDYAQWLGQKTGCSYDIPSQAEWIATVSHLQARDKTRLDSTVPTTGPLKSLLWGVREWSRSRCESGYYLLGRDDLTANQSEDDAVCMPAMFAIAGFRVVMNPASVPGGAAVGREMK